MKELIRQLSSLNSVSGNENEVRSFLLKQIELHCDAQVDPLGNIIAFKKGKKTPSKKVMLAAHMDEVGFIITGITEEGFLRLAPVGGIDPRVVFGTSVLIGQNDITGVIGGKAVHHLTGDEKEKAPGFSEMLIDIGVESKEKAAELVSPGDFAAFQSDFYTFGDNYIKGKALDDRIGCALLLYLIQGQLEYDTYFCFNVQEEVGLRGAKASAFTVRPDVALVLEATTAADLSGVEGDKRVCVLGDGPVISFMDGRTIYDQGLYQLAFETTAENHIKAQTKTAVTGGNDAGAIHLTANGVRTLAISLPCRYIHTPNCVVKYSDLEETQKLLNVLLGKLYD